MLKCILSISLSFLFFMANAHQAEISSTVLAEQENGQWILQLKAPLTAFEYEVKNNYGESSFETPEEFQDLVIKHLQENISFQFDESILGKLEGAIVRLGHETNVIFRVDGVPEDFGKITVKNSSFKNISRNKSALVILKKGFEQNQFILNNDNQHTLQLKTKGLEFVSASTEDLASISKLNVLGGISLIFILGTVLFFKFNLKRVVEA